MAEYDCPGHEGKCPFCKREEGHPKYIMGTRFREVNNLTGKPKVDTCCKKCHHNMEYDRKRLYRPSTIS